MRWVAMVGVIGGAAWIGVPTEARACSCAAEWTLVVPSAEHPAGAPLRFDSYCGGSFEPWSVTVDGMPANFGEPAFHGEIATMAIMPTPEVGAEVVVMVDCTQRFDDSACDVDDVITERARFTIGPPDTTAPPAALDVAFAFFEDDGNSCNSTEDHLTITADVEIGDREPETWIELVLSRADGLEVARTGRPMPADGGLATVLFGNEEALDFPEICVEAIVHDAAGNQAPGVQHCVVEDADEDDEPLELRGCACTSAPTPPWHAAFLGLLVFVLRRRHSVTPSTSRV
jgi:MYXO-CTERM domain-containing protein